MMASHKQLKAILALEVRKKLGSASVTPKLGEFPLFDEFFLNLADFWDLNNFLPFDFPDFLAYFTLSPPTPNLSTLPLLSFFLEAGLLLSFLLKADLLLLFLLETDLLGNLVVFNIEMSRATILLKP